MIVYKSKEFADTRTKKILKKNLKKVLTNSLLYDIIQLQNNKGTGYKSLKPKGIDTMANQKLTKKDYFNMILNLTEVKTNEELTTFIEHEIELLENKSANRKPTKTQTKNNDLRIAILDNMEDDKRYTIAEIIQAVPELRNDETITCQKVSALITQLKKDNLVTRIEEKRKAYFIKN